MASQIKLTYFNIRGLAEPLRFLFAYGDIEYEDNRIERADWADVKASFPCQKLPVLEVDGKELTQSSALCRYFARKVELMGASDWDNMLIDIAVDTITDIRLQNVQYAFETDEAVKAKKQKEAVEEVLPLYLSRLESQVKENDGHFASGKLSWADLYLAAIHETLSVFCGCDILASYPALQELVEKVSALPAIEAWIAKRPKTEL